MKNSLQCTHVSFRYSPKGNWVLDNFSHTFKPGITLIKGFSGCGKSTLLRLIAGYLKPHKGYIHYPEDKILNQNIGFVFQQLNLLPLASVYRNLDIVCSLAGLDSKSSKTRIDELLKKLGLSEFRTKKPANLSGGQQQRAAIARALAHCPSLILLDEPTSGLDDLNTDVITQTLCAELKDDSYIIICTHDSRLDNLAQDILDFNQFLPLDPHLQKQINK